MRTLCVVLVGSAMLALSLPGCRSGVNESKKATLDTFDCKAPIIMPTISGAIKIDVTSTQDLNVSVVPAKYASEKALDDVLATKKAPAGELMAKQQVKVFSEVVTIPDKGGFAVVIWGAKQRADVTITAATP